MSETRTVAPTDLSVRQAVILHIKGLLETATFSRDDARPEVGFNTTENLADPNVKLFDIVKMGSIDDIGISETPGCAIETTNEEVIELLMASQKRFRLFVAFKPVKDASVDAEDLINYYFARIEEVLVTDPHLGDTALSIDPVGNSTQSNGVTDEEPGGIMYFDVDYRHYLGQPFTQL